RGVVSLKATAPPALARLCRRCSGPDLALAQHDPLLGRETLQPHRPARMELVGGDADLRAEAVLEAVGEARAGVDHHARGIDLAQEAHRTRVMRGEDGVRVVRAVAI